METQLINLSELKPHPKNPRLALREDVVSAVEAQLAEGTFDPAHALLVRPVNGEFEIIAGHHRKAAAERAGLKSVPCWVREMDDEAAFMGLVTSNAQGELSPLEIGIHALECVGRDSKRGRGKKGGLGEYAKLIGMSQQYLSQLVQAAEVAKVTSQLVTLSEKTQHLCAIHKLPKTMWQPFVEHMLKADWSAEETGNGVTASVDYLNTGGITGVFADYLPIKLCALQIGLGHFTPRDFERLERVASGVLAALQEAEAVSLAQEWLKWLEDHAGNDSWQIKLVQTQRLSFEDRLADLVDAKKRAKTEPPSIVLADPPWRYDMAEAANRAIENQYPTQSVEEICADVPETNPDAVLFLWATMPKLIEAVQVMEAWGFKFRTGAVWDKEKIGMGYWFRGQHELLLVGVKGDAHPRQWDGDRASADRIAQWPPVTAEAGDLVRKKHSCMAIIVKFNKSRAEYLLQCLASGTPIQPQREEGWTGNDMLAVAGACFFGALSQGPASFRGRDIPKNLLAEYQEAEEAAFFNDLHAAVEFYGHLSRLVQDGAYDAGYDQDVQALVTQDGDGHKTVAPISGVRASGEAI